MANRNLAFGVAFLAATFSLASQAGTGTATINVTTSVDPSCTITAAPLAFGKYDPTSSTAKTQKSAITLTCVKNTQPLGVALSSGGNHDSTSRRMSNGTEFISYEVYKPVATDPAVDLPNTDCTDSATAVWGDDTNSSLHPSIAVDSSEKTYFLCGVIKARQDVGPGAYSDVLTATVSF